LREAPFFCPPGRPKAKSALLGGSEPAKRMSVGAFFAAGVT